MNVLEKAKKILEQPICDNCLGRQFGNLLSGYDNKQRGETFRFTVAVSIDDEKQETDMDLSNFSEFNFHNLETGKIKQKKCSICDDLFQKLDDVTEKIVKESKKYEFDTFVIGTKLTFDLIKNEEDLWERVGIDYCEPLKAEINREIGKKLEKRTKKKFKQTADIDFILDFTNHNVHAQVNSIFIYGEYQKLKRGIPQTKWPSGKYKTSVEEIAAKPFMKVTKGSGHKFHGAGREDIDAKCLGWRPFVLEILEPKIRKINIKQLVKKIGKHVKVRNPKMADIKKVREIKLAKIDKTYRAIVTSKLPLKKADLKILKKLGTIKQQTPTRVMHRRADLYRSRKVVKISSKFINNKKFELTVTGESGLYIKELISGDEGRTKPNVSELLNNECICKELDVIKIHTKKQRF